jgi:hypothetical protein
MMWQSRKALDLLRDPRCVVHSTVTDRAGTEGDVKVYGRAVPVDITEVGYFVAAGEGHETRTWATPAAPR